jgi:adenylate kinase family enzyme
VAARRYVIVASASGNGKTTLGRELAARLRVRFVEMDAWVHGPGWQELPDAELRERVMPVLALDGWVIDGSYERKLGTAVRDAADVIVWLDLPLAVWFTRLLRRTWRRVAHDEPLWNDNRESWRTAVWGWDSLFSYALRSHLRRRREWPAQLAAYPVVRLRSQAQVDAWLARMPTR